MLLDHQPSDMGEEEAPLGIVWVCIRFGELVMDPMVAAPLVDVILQTKHTWYNYSTLRLPLLAR